MDPRAASPGCSCARVGTAMWGARWFASSGTRRVGLLCFEPRLASLSRALAAATLPKSPRPIPRKHHNKELSWQLEKGLAEQAFPFPLAALLPCRDKAGQPCLFPQPQPAAKAQQQRAGLPASLPAGPAHRPPSVAPEAVLWGRKRRLEGCWMQPLGPDPANVAGGKAAPCGKPTSGSSRAGKPRVFFFLALSYLGSQ